MSQNKSGTVKVRIAVSVNPSGEWAAVGWGFPVPRACPRDEIITIEALSMMHAEYGSVTSFIEAEVPVPAAPTPDVITGTVKGGE